MNNMLIEIAGVLTIHIVDIISLKRIPLLKPIIWMIGISRRLYSLPVIIQDKVFLVRIFEGYNTYQKKTPMLLPN